MSGFRLKLELTSAIVQVFGRFTLCLQIGLYVKPSLNSMRD